MTTCTFKFIFLRRFKPKWSGIVCLFINDGMCSSFIIFNLKASTYLSASVAFSWLLLYLATKHHCKLQHNVCMSVQLGSNVAVDMFKTYPCGHLGFWTFQEIFIWFYIERNVQFRLFGLNHVLPKFSFSFIRLMGKFLKSLFKRGGVYPCGWVHQLEFPACSINKCSFIK
jgi:hypothetical protein